MLAERVHDGRVRVGVHHLAVRLDAGLAQERQRQFQAVLGGVAHVLVVDHVAVLRLVLRADHVGVDLLALRPLPDGVDQRLTGDRLVGDDEGALHRSSTGGGAPPPPAGVATAPSCARSLSLKPACTTFGMPYSYGPATTVGISSKLNTGGGEDTCHSIELARHGLPTAAGPCRQEAIML